MFRYIVFLILFLFSTKTSIFASRRIYLLHGFGSNTISMTGIDRALRKEGFKTVNYGYPSITKDLDTLGKQLAQEIASLPEDSVSFVTHSMGALVVRAMFKYSHSYDRFPVVNRIVMIAPPNRGAEIADFFSSNKFFSSILGPNLVKMRTDSTSYANRLPKPICCEVGVIIAVIKKNPGKSKALNKETDGFLTPQRTILGIEKDVAFVKSSHILVTIKRPAIKLVLRFLKTGSFSAEE